ncbi:MAG TPA: DEAD/DEAH box helicase [Acidimicrobiales bacterium]|nr:DEAD/DEAH box helicase [Acidimicrobiales bacterium]
MSPRRVRGEIRSAGEGSEAGVRRARFEQGLGLRLDEFQKQAMDAIDRGESVLVSAPTGSGKTLIADYAAAVALDRGGKAFYTTPIKALSNQKFAELSRRYGQHRVGLLTGDISHQPRAPIVVMTTEVLRNMLFSRSPILRGLDVVVLDEVHYLEDPYRGSVWEEVLVLTPRPVRFVSLSATVSNAADFGAWLTSVRGPTEVIVEDHRPVTLHHHFALAERRRDGLIVIPLLRGGRPNPDGITIDQRRRRNPHHRYRAPRRVEVVEYLAAAGMLPAITFIFSRAACDDATRQCLRDGVRLTTPDERDRIRELTEGAVERLGDDDLRTLGYGPWSAALEAGIAPHHAGLVPAFRQAVEQCFSEGLLKVVFATETLALGINMPARTVVVERFAKFRGAEVSSLTAGEYRQLTGRAGRRGIDTVGHALVLWSAAVSFGEVARTAVAPPPDLVSSFHPTYNLAVNLVRRWSREEAEVVVDSSYGQWQAAPGSVSLAAQLDRRLTVLAKRGFVAGWRLTDAGATLASIYHESDLLVAEALRQGVLDRLGPAGLAGVVSALTFEARRSTEAARPARIRPSVAERLELLGALAASLRVDERRLGLRRTRMPDPGLAGAVVDWAEGASLETVLRESEVAPGDFVRNVRQLIDLLRQLAGTAREAGTSEDAGQAVVLLRRGVIGADDPAAVGSAPDRTGPP